LLVVPIERPYSFTNRLPREQPSSSQIAFFTNLLVLLHFPPSSTNLLVVPMERPSSFTNRLLCKKPFTKHLLPK
jgi:hypothetical protein